MRSARSHAATPLSVGAAVALGAAASVGALALVSGAAASLFARTLVTPPTTRPEPERVLAVRPDVGEIDLRPGGDAELPGEYGLWFDGGTGHARVGPVIASGPRRVTRELIGVDRGRLRPGARGRLSGWAMASPRDVGLPFSSVQVPTQYGTAPAWLFPAEEGQEGAWAIHVHGRATSREETLRGIPTLHRAGRTSLVISYRNDGDAPRSPDGRYSLGETEWRDVHDAIVWAEARGARSVVLIGWSMGGAIALQTLLRSSRRELVSGVVLESPVIDWVSTLRFQARLRRVPSRIGSAAIALVQQPWSTAVTGQSSAVRLSVFDFVTRAAEIDVPVLLLHSVDDGFVPSGPSEALAAARRDRVTFVRFDTARHTRLWNVARSRWERVVSEWLGEVDR